MFHGSTIIKAYSLNDIGIHNNDIRHIPSSRGIGLSGGFTRKTGGSSCSQVVGFWAATSFVLVPKFCGCFCKSGVLVVSVLLIRALICGVCIMGPDFWKLPCHIGGQALCHTTALGLGGVLVEWYRFSGPDVV